MATAGIERVQMGSCGVLQRPAEAPWIIRSQATFAARGNLAQLREGDKMSDDAKFILGFG
jgi:hypothetical protein